MEITKARYTYNKQQRKRRGKGGFIAVLLASLLLLSSGGYTAAALSKDVPSLVATTSSVPAYVPEAVALAWPTAGQAAVGSLDHGVLARSSEAQGPLPIASMTKVITALAVLQKAPLAAGEDGPQHVFTQEDKQLFSMYLAKNGSVVPVTVGQSFSQRQALQALLLVSANNIADMLVRVHFGTMDAYTAYANQMVQGWGLSGTVISDASGFSPQTVSTPADLIVVAQKALQNQVLAEVMSQKEALLPGVGSVRNTNRLLSEPNVIGLKTGTTDEAGSCLLFAANHKIDESYTVTVIGVIMGARNATSLFRDAKSLLDSAYPQFASITVLPAGTAVGTLGSEWGQAAAVVTAADLVTYGWRGTSYSFVPNITATGATAHQGEEVGTVHLTGKAEDAVALVTDTTIEPPSAFWRLKNYL